MLPTWIGLSDLLAENQYAWSDGVSPVLYTNWNEKEPNNAGGTVRTLQRSSDMRPVHVGLGADWFLVPLTGTLRGHGSQPPGDREVERRRLSQGPQLRLLQDEM